MSHSTPLFLPDGPMTRTSLQPGRQHFCSLSVATWDDLRLGTDRHGEGKKDDWLVREEGVCKTRLELSKVSQTLLAGTPASTEVLDTSVPV